VEEDVRNYWDDFKEERRKWKLEETVQDLPLWRTRFGGTYGLLVWHYTIE